MIVYEILKLRLFLGFAFPRKAMILMNLYFDIIVYTQSCSYPPKESFCVRAAPLKRAAVRY